MDIQFLLSRCEHSAATIGYEHLQTQAPALRRLTLAVRPHHAPQPQKTSPSELQPDGQLLPSIPTHYRPDRATPTQQPPSSKTSPEASPCQQQQPVRLCRCKLLPNPSPPSWSSPPPFALSLSLSRNQMRLADTPPIVLASYNVCLSTTATKENSKTLCIESCLGHF